jgi:acyl-CoA hydrolase
MKLAYLFTLALLGHLNWAAGIDTTTVISGNGGDLDFMNGGGNISFVNKI